MSSLRSTSGSRRGRQSSGEARTTTDGGTTREGQYLWKDKNCEVMLELVIAELKADDYRSRMPDVAARKELKKYFELMGEKISWDPEITSKIGYLRKLWIIHGQLVKRTGVAVDPASGQIDMMETWWRDRIAQVQSTLDVDGTTIDQQQETQTAEPIVDLTSDQGCNRSIRSMPSRRLSRRKTSFEAQVESGFQRVVDTRLEFLEELRSRKIQKITYGDATSLLEKLPIEQLGVFWWAANKLLKNDADIKYMESILGTDRHGIPCNQVDLLTTSQNQFQSVRIDGSTATGANIGNGFMSFLGVHSTGLEEPRREPTSFNYGPRGIENLDEDEIMELMLLEEEEFLQRYMHPILQYYKTNFFKEPMNKDWGNGWKMIRDQIYRNEVSCRTLIRMSSEAFIRLCEVLHTKYGLQESNNIKVEESVAIFLILCGQNDSQRDIGLRFGHAQETICRKFHYVLGAVEQLANINSLHGDKRYWPYFSGSIGALDGTHVPVMVTPGRDALRFMNRKGTASLNVLGDIDFEEFDMGRDTTPLHSNVNNHSDDESEEQVNQNTSTGVYMKIVRDHIIEQIW
ncbi:hypothetical protein Bca52824_031058 [Brassica carinata]|uniref:DUF8040 domain-containing protein n=1 Tax=Brassica carinata TaxID=52824 RepID=A0A8X7S9Z7_BRACI|nr:hypothetical protein Bca52824_031058 [Brassica carinata]